MVCHRRQYPLAKRRKRKLSAFPCSEKQAPSQGRKPLQLSVGGALRFARENVSFSYVIFIRNRKSMKPCLHFVRLKKTRNSYFT